MEWYWIVILTVFATQLINFLAFQMKNMNSLDIKFLEILPCFAVWYPLYWLCYPVRTHRLYKKCRKQFEKHGTTYWQYMFGKRIG
jgi:hypothetical protein